MFPTLQLEIMDRFTAVEQHFRGSRSLKGDTALTAKGLVFVEVYAVYEFTVKSVMRVAIAEIVARAHVYADLSPSLLAVFLDPELQSLRDCFPKKIWENRLRLFDRSLSDEPIKMVNTLPMDGSHFRYTHVELILRALGIKRRLARRRRHPDIIDDVVNNRNSIAHGDETAVDIGRRYSRQDIAKISVIMKGICLRLVSLAAEHCADPSKHRK